MAGLPSGVTGPPPSWCPLLSRGAGGVTALGSSPQVSSASGCVGVALSKVEFPFLCLVLVLGVASKSRSV